jgi:hypothetical protein
MSFRLPAHFRSRTVANEARVALSRRIIRNPGTEYTPSRKLSLHLKIQSTDSHAVRQRRFSAKVHANKVDGAGAGGGENAKVVPLGK